MAVWRPRYLVVVSTSNGNRIALVTGGSRGLGRNTLTHLADRGVDAIFTYRVREDEANSLLAELAAKGRRAAAFRLDTGDASAFPAFAGAVARQLAEWQTDRFDYLVNNAGASLHKSIVEMTEEDLDNIYRVNFKGVYFVTQSLLPLLRDGGRIINVSSGLTRFTNPGSSGYAAMKGALEVLTRYLARELADRQITVNTVAPGAIATDFSGGMVRDNPEINRMVAQMTALGRAGLPEDIGPMIASLLSDDNRWVTGQRIEVSGGMFL